MSDIVFPDISEFQGAVDHSALVNGLRASYGLAVTIARINYGLVKVDNFADANIDGLRGAGCDAIGWYCYLIAGQNPAAQADLMVRVLQAHGGLQRNEFLVCDVEEGSGDQSGRVNAFLDELDAGLQVPYPAGQDWWYSGLNFALAHNLTAARGQRWIAAYAAPEPSLPHTAWQFTNSRSFPGIANPCDASVFHGSPADFLAVLGIPTASPPEDPMALEALAYRFTPIPNQVHAAYVDSKGILRGYVFTQGGSQWAIDSGLVNPQGVLFVPGPVTWDDFNDQLHVYARTQDNRLWHAIYSSPPGAWAAEFLPT